MRFEIQFDHASDVFDSGINESLHKGKSRAAQLKATCDGETMSTAVIVLARSLLRLGVALSQGLQLRLRPSFLFAQHALLVLELGQAVFVGVELSLHLRLRGAHRLQAGGAALLQLLLLERSGCGGRGRRGRRSLRVKARGVHGEGASGVQLQWDG